MLFLRTLKNKKNKTSDYTCAFYSVNHNNYFNSTLIKDSETIRKDDKQFYKSILNFRINEYSQANIFELNFFLKVKYY